MRSVKLLIIGILISMSTSSVSAAPLKHWGFKLGYTTAKQNWEHDWISNDDISLRAGLHAGVFTEWLELRGLSIRASFQYEQKGFEYTFMTADESGALLGEMTSPSRLDYISVPILLKYSVVKDKWVGSFMVGPRLDIFLGADEGEGNITFGFEDEYKDLVLGLSAGISVERKVTSKNWLLVEFQYNYDPFWLYEHTNIATGNDFRMKNESFNISIGITMM